MTTSSWTAAEFDSHTKITGEENYLRSLARGEIPAVIFRQAFPREECRSLVKYFVDQELMFESTSSLISAKALTAGVTDKWTGLGLNPDKSPRRRIDIGTSLGNIGEDQEHFLSDSAQTHELFSRLFADRLNPIQTIYDRLQDMTPGKNVVTAYEPDGRKYGPAIFRIHYGGYTYGPHHDSVRLREKRESYSVYKYDSQLAGVLCLQNTTLNQVTAQGIVHRQRWNEEVDPYMKQGRFHEYAEEHQIQRAQIDLEEGDLYFFSTNMIHEVPGVAGDLPRIVLATFIGYSDDEAEVMVWS